MQTDTQSLKLQVIWAEVETLTTYNYLSNTAIFAELAIIMLSIMFYYTAKLNHSRINLRAVSMQFLKNIAIIDIVIYYTIIILFLLFEQIS